MPELPEVEALRGFLDERLTGRSVERVLPVAVSVLKTYEPPLSALHGRAFTGVSRYGKFLALGTDGPQDGPHLVVHLARAGWLRWQDRLPATPPRPGKGPLALRLWLAGPEGGGFDLTEAGTRKRLAVYCVRHPAEVPGVARLGPDPLADGFTPDVLAGLLGGSRHRIKGVLRDQSVIAGIGNAYSDEILHAARMSPYLIAAELDDAQTAVLHEAIGATLREAVARSRGLAAGSLKAEKKGGLRVHGRTGEPCPVCGDTVREVSFSDSSLNYCPTCQTGGQAPRRPQNVASAQIGARDDQGVPPPRASVRPDGGVARRGAIMATGKSTGAGKGTGAGAGAGRNKGQGKGDGAGEHGGRAARERPYDVVLFGATGFTGELTARHLAAHAPDTCRWALAGRSMQKLEALRDRLADIRPECAELPLLRADVTDSGSLRDIAEQARVVVTTVGPYIRYGARLVAACAEAGTDYLDLCGEPEFVDLMYLRHHARAQETGARLVHACGFDSVPHDLGARFTVEHLPEGVPLRVDGYVRAMGGFSGGTFASTLTAFSRFSRTARTGKERRMAEPRPADRRVRTPLDRVRRDREQGVWAVPLPTIDAQIVGRSAAALERYGPDFSYRHYAAVKHLPLVAGGLAGAGAAFVLAQHPATRRLLTSRLAPGEGPDESRRAKSWFSVRFVGEGGGRRVLTEVAGGDPGYGETAKILAESALCLALDDSLPPVSGQVTTAVAMGEALTGRLVKAGLIFRVLKDTAV